MAMATQFQEDRKCLESKIANVYLNVDLPQVYFVNCNKGKGRDEGKGKSEMESEKCFVIELFGTRLITVDETDLGQV